jgi:hypothetical protein
MPSKIAFRLLGLVGVAGLSGLVMIIGFILLEPERVWSC